MLKSIGVRASPCFKPYLIGNLSHKSLPTRTVLYLSVWLIFINSTSFLGIQKMPKHNIKIPRNTETRGYFYKYCYLFRYFENSLFPHCKTKANLLLTFLIDAFNISSDQNITERNNSMWSCKVNIYKISSYYSLNYCEWKDWILYWECQTVLTSANQISPLILK